MDLQRIKYFLTLAKELHFWNTSEKMFITQSALSRQIKALEQELGVVLFERNKRNVKLTAAGAFLRDRWSPLLDEIDRIHTQTRKIHQGVYGSLIIGYPGSISYGLLPAVVESIAERYPELKIELVEPTDVSLEHLLMNYQMDLAFRREPALNPALESICLTTEYFSLVVPANHPVLQHPFRGIQDLKDEKFIMSALHHKTKYVQGLRQIFADHHFEPKVYLESDFGTMILNLVARGAGVSILPSSYATSAHPGVRFINLPHQVSLYVTWRREDSSPVLVNVLQEIQRVALQL